MKLEEFRRRAAEMWEEIPDILVEGVDSLYVEEGVEPHPGLAGIYTLGECRDSLSSGYSAAEIRSDLVLYYGSFRALAQEDPAFDWEGELWETILHELLHHREATAGASGLEDFDWAVEHNQRRYAGEPFDPTFYRAVPPGPDGTYRIESETFVETRASKGDREVRFEWREREFTVRVPPETRPAFVQVRNLARGRLWVVVREARPWWKRLLPTGEGEPVELERRALPVSAA